MSKITTTDYGIFESPQLHQTMLDSSPYIHLIFDDKLQVADCNPVAMKYFGFSDKAAFMKEFMKLVLDSIPEYQPSGAKSTNLAYILQYTLEHGYTEFETELIIRGKFTPFSVVSKRISYKDSFAIVLYLIDLGSLKEAKNDILRQDRLLKSINEVASELISATPDKFDMMIWNSLKTIGQTVNVDRMYIWQNFTDNDQLCCRQIYEWSEGAEPQQGKDLISHIPYEEVPFWQNTLVKGTTINAIVSKLEGHEREILEAQDILSVLVIPVFLQGEFWGFIGLDDCHSERIFAEVEESTLRSGGILIISAIIRNEMTSSMIAAREMALASTKAKSEFLSRMSHEMRTPMSAIIGMTSIAKSSSDPEKKEYCLDKIDEASKHLLGVINDILDMSKIEANKFELSHTVFNFEKMLMRVIDVINFKIEESSQNLIVNIDPDVPDSIISDEQRLAQVITNLLSNATKFTPEKGTITVSVRKVSEKEGLCTLEIKISDTGIGISKEQQAKLFHSFEQADGSISRKFGGTGLGLSISKNIIELMNGEISVESESGKGSTFCFTIEVQRGNSIIKHYRSEIEVGTKTADVDKFIAREHAYEPFKVSFDGYKILLAEDIDINREILIALLDSSGIEIECAENGAEAYQMFKNAPNRYDMIFMDVHMPEMNGYEATQKIRAMKIPKAQTIPIIAMTANVFKEDIERCLAAGMNDHVGKPIDVDILMEKMKTYLLKVK